MKGGIRNKSKRIELDLVSKKIHIQKLISNPNIIKFDVRSKNEIEKGHVCSSILLYDFIKDYNLILQRDFMNFIKNDKNTEILIYCKSGRRAKLSAQILHKLGFNNKIYIVVNGGFEQMIIEDIIDENNICIFCK